MHHCRLSLLLHVSLALTILTAGPIAQTTFAMQAASPGHSERKTSKAPCTRCSCCAAKAQVATEPVDQLAAHDCPCKCPYCPQTPLGCCYCCQSTLLYVSADWPLLPIAACVGYLLPEAFFQLPTPLPTEIFQPPRA